MGLSPKMILFLFYQALFSIRHYKIIVPTDVRILYPSSLSQIILPPVFLVMQYQFTMYH